MQHKTEPIEPFVVKINEALFFERYDVSFTIECLIYSFRNTAFHVCDCKIKQITEHSNLIWTVLHFTFSPNDCDLTVHAIIVPPASVVAETL